LPLAKRKKSSFPFSSQFTPSQVDLPRLLELVRSNQGNAEDIAQSIKDNFFREHASGSQNPEYNRLKLAKNVRSALVDYDLLDEKSWKLTPIGEELFVSKGTPDLLYSRFGRHILLTKRGLDLVNIVKKLKAREIPVTLETLASEARAQGLYVPSGTMQMSDMRSWLTKAGVFDGKDQINEYKLKELIGYDSRQISDLANLSTELRAFLRALSNINEKPPLVSSKVARTAERLYTVRFPEKSLPKTLAPLEDLGFVKLTKTTEGRGAKPFLVTPTDKFSKEYLEPILDAISSKTGLSRSQIDRPFREILAEVQSPDRYKKGMALELVAANLARLLGLNLVGWRLRANQTAGAEVDLVADNAGILFSRWQIQCKNTKSSTQDDIAREIGVANLLNTTVVMLVTTGTFSKPAIEFATKTNETSHLNIILISGSELRSIANDFSRLFEILERKAGQIMERKEQTLKLT
jgi:hypothetical protein